MYLMAYKFVWLIFIAAAVLAVCGKIENVSAAKKQTFLERGNVVEEVFLKRKKRFLLFEKGSTALVQANIAKAMIAEMPRGLNQITEFTLNYDLPWTIEPFLDLKPKKSTTKATTTTTTMKSITHDSTMWWNYYNEPPAWRVDSNRKPIKKLWCPKQHIFQKYFDSSGKNALPWCDVHNFRQKRVRKKRQQSSSTQQATPTDTPLLFDLITHLANMHGFNARHCIMRTLCESRHLLFPPGRLLFHDLVRILLSHAQPATQRHAPFRAAIHRENLQECIQLYGLHCRWSFLQHFTESIGTAANSIPISPAQLRSIQHAEFM